MTELLYRIVPYNNKKQLPSIYTEDLNTVFEWMHKLKHFDHVKLALYDKWTCKECRAMNLTKSSTSQFKRCKHCGDISAKTRS